MSIDSGRDPSGQALAVPVEPVARLDPSGFDPSRITRLFRNWLSRRKHVHEWHDWYVFDSSGQTTFGPRPSFRVTGQQIMMLCACGKTERKHLRTWREARIARKRLPYKRWGIWSFSLPVPDAIAMEASGRDGETRLDPKDDSAGRRYRTGDSA